MPTGVLFALAAYAVYSTADALIKSFNVSLSVYEIGFFTTIFSLIPMLLAKQRDERWRDVFQMQHPWLVQLRSLTGVLATALVIYAFTHIPLAEVYSIAFLNPVFLVIMSVLWMKEIVTWQRWILVGVSFAGVLLVVRPGFQELHLGHLAALVCAMFGATSTALLRTVVRKEKRTSLVATAVAYALVFNGVLMLPGFTMPNLTQMAALASIGTLGGTGALLFFAATRRANISEIASLQYSQILWAIIYGAVFYREFPDAIAFGGLTIVVVAGVLNILADQSSQKFLSRFRIGGPRQPQIIVPPIEASNPTDL